jgi:hypothetical protein
MSYPDTDNPCAHCGACCASYRVDFSIYELESSGGRVPDGLTVPVNHYTSRMRGTDHVPVRCAALVGCIGTQVGCGIYAERPNPCHELEAMSDGCNRARIKHGLEPLG